MKDKLEGMNEQFREGYAVGVSITYNCLENNGLDNISQYCEVASKCYRDNKSGNFISGMDTAISTIVHETSRRINGPRVGMRKVYRRW